MTTLPNKDIVLDQEIITSEWKTYYGMLFDFFKQIIGGGDVETVTVNVKSISSNNAILKVDTENLLEEQDVENISIANYSNNAWIMLFANSSDHKITIKTTGIGDGAIKTFDGNDFVLSTDFPMILQKTGNTWTQVDISGYARATLDEVSLGENEKKFVTVSQLAPYKASVTSAAMGVVLYSTRKPEGALLCDSTEYNADIFPDLYEFITSGKLPSVSFSEYQSQVSSQGYCEKFGLDESTRKFKCPMLTSIPFGETSYKPYIIAYNTATAKSLIELQSILDKALALEEQFITDKGELEIYVETSLQNITQAKEQAIQAIKTQETTSVNSVKSAQTTAESSIDEKTSTSLDSITSHTSTKTQEFNSNYTTKLNSFNTNAQQKLDTYNTNDTEKTSAFNANASEKQAQVDASALAAKTSETNALSSANLAESWAIGDISSRPEGSAKYWAEEASKGQKQADWNQTDDTQVDFIKNKPDLSLKQDKLNTAQLNAVNSGITSAKVGTYDGYAAQINARQLTSNLSQTVDSSTTKYPSNKAVQDGLNTRQLISNLSQVIDSSTTSYPSNKAVQDAIAASGGGADTDLSNITIAGKDVIAANATPKWTTVVAPQWSINTEYVAPANGILQFYTEAKSSISYKLIYRLNGVTTTAYFGGGGGYDFLIIPLAKGTVYKIESIGTAPDYSVGFYGLKGGN